MKRPLSTRLKSTMRDGKIACLRTLFLSLIFFAFLPIPMAGQAAILRGRVVDPQGNALPNATVELISHDKPRYDQILQQSISGPDGRFEMKLEAWGSFEIKVEA
jgi:hypothetical protein